MIAVDTSAWIDFSKGVHSTGSAALEKELAMGSVVLPTPVVFEILSGPGLTKEASKWLIQIPQLEILDGYWERAAEMRRSLLRRGLKANSMDSLIAQNCIDNDVALIVCDRDFRHFRKFGLVLVSSD